MRKHALYLFFAFVASASASARADELRYLDHSELAIANLYNDIANAKSSIDLSYLIWDPCSSVGKVLLKKLEEKTHPKKTAGHPNPTPVKVRMLIDAYYERNELRAMQDAYTKAGIDLKFYGGANPITVGHTHSKVALFDNDVPGHAHLVTGGRNVADEYYGMAKDDYVDRDVAVDGPSAAEDKDGNIAKAADAYGRLWANPRSVKAGPPTPKETAKLAACTEWTPKDAQLEKYLQLNAAKLASRAVPVKCKDVSFTMDDMTHVGRNGPARLRSKPTSEAVLQLVSKAKISLTMENQYFIPDDTYMKGLLRNQKANGVRINLYSNMFDKNSGDIESMFDQGALDMVDLWHNKEMQKMNGNGETNHMSFRIAGLMDRWKFSPPDTGYRYHAKTFVADHKDAIVSSFNIDPRSMSLNGESALTVRNCPAFAGKVESIANLTSHVWSLEEELHVCLNGKSPAPPTIDPLTYMVEFFTKELQ